MQRPALPTAQSRVVSRGPAAALIRFVLAGLCLLAAGPLSAADLACPDQGLAVDDNGATLSVRKSGLGAPLDIIAIGSSSTEGVGASAPSHAYPAELANELTREDGIAAEVRNEGVGGELAATTLPRLLSALKSGWAKLVIWQVGTNDALVGVDEARFQATLEKGVAAARAAGVPLLLIDPQYTPKCPDAARYERFVAIVDQTATREHVPVLSRFAMMKRFGAKSALALLSGDGLHMNDRGYRCLAHALAEAIEDAGGAKL